jgi:plasmid stabilization system protein ParE
MNVRWRKGALRQAASAAEHIARDRPLVARAWGDGLFEVGDRIGEYPKSGRVVVAIENDNIREVVYRNVRVIYRIDPTEVVVLLVWHQRRDPRKLERLLRPYRMTANPRSS